MEIVYRIREDRTDRHGRVAVWADIHWPGHRVQPGVGVKVVPRNWQPGKENSINSREADSNAKNLRLRRISAAVGKVFTAAEAAEVPPQDVTEEQVHAAVRAVVGGAAPAPSAAVVAPAGASVTSTWAELNQQWQAENAHVMAKDSLRQYVPVVAKLEEFDPAVRLAGFTKTVFARYIALLLDQQKKDSTIQTHYKFLRECHRLVGLPVPAWLEMPTGRRGRAPSLKRPEFFAMAALAGLPAHLQRELDVWVFQVLLLVRDSDLRGLLPHHVREIDLPRYGPTLCAELYQQKTGEPVRLPLPPAAAAIWKKYDGRLPVLEQSTRAKRAKVLGQLAGLTREFVKVQFSGRTKIEDVGPLWKFLGTHAARHTGADLLVFGSEGDRNLKELALGHVMPSVYGYDSVERYGPAILDAWRVVFNESGPLAAPIIANGLGVIPRRYSFAG